ncbi:MAG TPA: sigma-70 family RNA polymerase sigma factor [Chitinophagaceae bacterium]|nr:sigma-70 family RNA polymerase sigma factor [Chitinophagaceae bacterium]
MHHGIYEQQVVSARDKMFRFALRLLKNTEDARDVVQDALVRIWDQREKLEGVENPEAWCMQVTKNLCLDRFKAGKRRSAAAQNIQPGESSIDPTPYEQVERKDRMERIRKMIDALPDKFRMIIHLRDVEGFSYKEISVIMELSMDEVKVNLFRARKALKDNLTKNKVYGIS